MKVETAVGALLRMVSLKLPRLPGNRVVEFGEGVANVLPSHIMINNTMPKQQTCENHMIQTRTLATFTTFGTVLVLFIGSFSTIQPVRGVSMTLAFGQSYTNCLAAYSSGTWTHIYNLGPSGKTWSVQDGIGLSGGDNTQYVHWSFSLIDNSQPSNAVATDDGSAIYWERQYPPYMYGNTLAASAGGTVTVQTYISNDDGASQCFIDVISAYYY